MHETYSFRSLIVHKVHFRLYVMLLHPMKNPKEFIKIKKIVHVKILHNLIIVTKLCITFFQMEEMETGFHLIGTQDYQWQQKWLEH